MKMMGCFCDASKRDHISGTMCPSTVLSNCDADVSAIEWSHYSLVMFAAEFLLGDNFAEHLRHMSPMKERESIFWSASEQEQKRHNYDTVEKCIWLICDSSVPCLSHIASVIFCNGSASVPHMCRYFATHFLHSDWLVTDTLTSQINVTNGHSAHDTV